MSRIRSIHPGLWTDEAFVSLSPFARLLFMGIWNECDDQGSFEWSPLKLKMRLLPADSANAAELLDEMAAAEAVMRYEVDGKSYGAVRNFCQYQRPKKPNSIYSQTDEVRAWVNIKARSVRDGGEEVPNELPTGGEKPRLMEDEGGKGKENPPTPRKRGNEGKHLIPDDWEVPKVADLPPQAKACAEQWTAASYAAHAEAFHGYWRSERKMKTDWRGTWANRVVALHSQVMRDQKFGNAPPAVGAASPNTGQFDTPEARAAFLAKLEDKPWSQPPDKPPDRPAAFSQPPRTIGQLARQIQERAA